jgi:hypothetical protein
MSEGEESGEEEPQEAIELLEENGDGISDHDEEAAAIMGEEEIGEKEGKPPPAKRSRRSVVDQIPEEEEENDEAGVIAEEEEDHVSVGEAGGEDAQPSPGTKQRSGTVTEELLVEDTKEEKEPGVEVEFAEDHHVSMHADTNAGEGNKAPFTKPPAEEKKAETEPEVEEIARHEKAPTNAATKTASLATTSQRPDALDAVSTPPSAATSSSGATTASSAICDPTVLTLSKGSRVLHIVGTAHISSESADLAGRLVREVKPDAVFIELDAARLSRAFEGGIPPPGIRIALQDEKGNLQLGVTQKMGLAEQLLIKFINAASNPSMYQKLETSGIPVGEEVS